MDSLDTGSDLPKKRPQRRVLLSELAVHLAEQREAILRHLLFWLQDQTYYRERWHRRLSQLALFEGESLEALRRLLLEIDDAAAQFPHGFAPAEKAGAERLSSRLHMLWQEVAHLQKLCGAYVARTAAPALPADW